MLRSEAITYFLNKQAREDLAKLYSTEMEVQVNVARDGGTRVDKEYNGRNFFVFTDGFEEWKSFRMPLNAKSDPQDADKKINFNLEKHVESIGMTGWNWKQRVSKWVAFDFDEISGHSARHKATLTPEMLSEVEEAAKQIEWVTVRKSTSGKGLHLYVFLPDVPTENHSEHAALGRSILGLMSAITGFDFQAKVDACGGNMWVWHRKMVGTDGLTVLKYGKILEEIPPNWRDHLKVVKGQSSKSVPGIVKETIPGENSEDWFLELCGQHQRTPLDDSHRKLIDFLSSSSAKWWWDSDNHCLVTHTIHLRDAHEQLGLIGIFKTIATGKEFGSDHNCFMFPTRRGGWNVRRFGLGVQEADTWIQDANGWTKCYFNRPPTLAIAARTYSGTEDPKTGAFKFSNAAAAIDAAKLIGVTIELDPFCLTREATLKVHKDGRLLVEVLKGDKDSPDKFKGWHNGKTVWSSLYYLAAQVGDSDSVNIDGIVRHIVTETGGDCGWVINSENSWREEPLVHVRSALGSMGYTAKDITSIIGESVIKAWTLISLPFDSEFPGNRVWNRNAAKLSHVPTQDLDRLNYPTWSKILKHVGASLDISLKDNDWAQTHGIDSGEQYLMCWIASLFQHPTEPLPYLFLFGPQSSGKSILHEALALLMTRGVQRADITLTSNSTFNAELLGAVLCVIEETDLRLNKSAHNRIKDYVTSREIPIHPKGQTPYLVTNTTHWIQCSNDQDSCPIFPGDTRITALKVDSLDPLDMIPKRQLILSLKKEAPDFLAAALNLVIPPSNDRLMVPVVESSEKRVLESINSNPLQDFIDENCFPVEGEVVKFSDFYDRFFITLSEKDQARWTKQELGRHLPTQFPKGRMSAGQFYIGNISFIEVTPTKPKIILSEKGLLKHVGG